MGEDKADVSRLLLFHSSTLSPVLQDASSVLTLVAFSRHSKSEKGKIFVYRSRGSMLSYWHMLREIREPSQKLMNLPASSFFESQRGREYQLSSVTFMIALHLGNFPILPEFVNLG
jgi:hypothetical protein